MANYYNFKDENELPIQEEAIIVVTPVDKKNPDELIIRELKNGEFVEGTEVEMEVGDIPLENTELNADIHDKDMYISMDTAPETMAAFEAHEKFTVECEGSVNTYGELIEQEQKQEYDEFDNQ